MATDEPTDPDQHTFITVVLRGVAWLVLLPLVPLAVLFNALGTAERLSVLPGISERGGFRAAFASGLYIMLIVALVLGGALVVIGAGTSVIGAPSGTSTPAITPTATPTQMPTQTPTPTSMPTATPSQTAEPTPATPTAEMREDYREVERRFRQMWEREDVADDPTVPPLLGTDIRNDDELWVVFAETDIKENASQLRYQWTSVANAYLHAYNQSKEQEHFTSQLYAIGWNNTGPRSSFTVYTETNVVPLAEGQISYNQFWDNFMETARGPSREERQIARDIAEHPPDDN